MQIIGWISNKTSNDDKMKKIVRSILVNAVVKYQSLLRNTSNFSSAFPYFLVQEPSQDSLSQITAIEIKLLLSSGKFKDVSFILSESQTAWRWRLMFSWINDKIEDDESLYSLIKSILNSLQEIQFSKLPLDIVKQLEEITALFPVTEACIKEVLQTNLDSIHKEINGIPFLMHEVETTDKSIRSENLNELVSWTLLYILVLKQSYNQRNMKMDKTLNTFVEMAYETCENVDYLLILRSKTLSCFDLTSVASRSVIEIKLKEGLELIKEIKHFFPNMWNDELNQLILSTVQYEFLPSIDVASHIIHHYNDLSSTPKFRIQLNQLLNMKWNKVFLSNGDAQNFVATEHANEKIALSDYVIQSVPNSASKPSIKSNQRKGFDKLCEQYINSCLDHDMDLSHNLNPWLSSSPDSSFSFTRANNKEIKFRLNDASNHRSSWNL